MSVESSFSRAQLLSRGARGGAALLVAGAPVAAFAPSAAADPLSDNDLAFARLLVGVELLAADFYTRALAAQKFGPAVRKALKVALMNEQEHYRSVAAILTGAGLTPAVAGDFDFAYPKQAFATKGSIARLGSQLETTFLGAYLGALNGLQSRTFLAGLGSIAANEAQHLSIFDGLLLGRPLTVSFPKALAIEEVSNAMDAFVS
jgi:hypothetical protein